MTAIHLGPQDIHPVRLYDLPDTRFRLTPRTMGAITAVALLYAGGGMMLNLAGIEFQIPDFSQPPPIIVTTFEPLPVEDPVERPAPAATLPVRPTDLSPTNEYVEPLPVTPDPTPTVIEGPATNFTPVETPATTPTPVVTPPPAPAVIRNPSWLQKPSSAQLGRLYPARAAERGVRGAATMECRVTAQGTVNGCVVLRESPTGYGFGEAALASTRYFRLNPRTIDGQAIEGAKVQIPMGFNLSE
jgi:protein TonB